MQKSSRKSRITASPLLVGAVTTVIAIVGVFFSYNANTGLPFVPSYRINGGQDRRRPGRCDRFSGR